MTQQQYHTEVKPQAIDQHVAPLTSNQVQQVAEAAKTAGENLIAIDPRTNPDGYPPAKP